MSPESERRKASDVRQLQMNDFKVKMEEGLDVFEVEFHGPKDSPYEDGVWRVRVDMPPDYPYEPPKLVFVNSIFHPNIHSLHGTICLNVLHDEWSAIYDLVNIFEIFLPQLLLYPNPEDPFNSAAADLLNQSKELFEQAVRGQCAAFANKKDIQFESESGSKESGSEESISEDGSRSGADESA